MQNVEALWCVANLYECLVNARNNVVLSRTSEGQFVHAVNVSAVLFPQEVIIWQRKHHYFERFLTLCMRKLRCKEAQVPSWESSLHRQLLWPSAHSYSATRSSLQDGGLNKIYRGFGGHAVQLCNAYKSDRCLRRQVPQNCRQPACEDIRRALL